jgi:hypothetical protein
VIVGGVITNRPLTDYDSCREEKSFRAAPGGARTTFAKFLIVGDISSK